MPHPLIVREYTGLDGLRALEIPWRRIADALPDAEYYQDFDWFLVYCAHAFDDDQVLRFLAVEDPSGEVLGIVSLESRIERIRRVPIRIWAMVGSRENDVLMMAPSADILCRSPEDGTLTLRAVTMHLASAQPSSGMLLLGRSVARSLVWQASTPLAQGDYLEYSRGGFSVINTDRPFAELAEGLSRDFLRKLRRRRERLESHGAVEFEVITADEERFASAYQQFLDIEASGWKGEKGARSALRFNSVQREFLEHLIGLPSEVSVQVHRLMVRDTCVGAECWLRYRCMLARLKIGYDERFRAYGIGNLMMNEALMRACLDPKINRINRLSSQAGHRDWGPDQFNAWRWRYIPLPNCRSWLPRALLLLPQSSALKALMGQRVHSLQHP